MMYGQNKAAAQYRAVRSHGLVADASPTRLVQIMFEHILSYLATVSGCMQRIKDNRPLNDVIAKGNAMSKAIALIGQLNGTLDMERGGQIAENLRALYEYMLNRLTLANANNDASIVAEVAGLVAKIKSGWDQIVTDSR
jgi:flagellar secretion chaperone FliS